MGRSWMVGLMLLACVAGGLWFQGNAGSETTNSGTSKEATITGTVTATDFGGFSRTLTVTEDRGVSTIVSLDDNTTVTAQGKTAQLGDVKPGQKVQVTGRKMLYVGQFIAKTITITKDLAAPAASTTPAKTTSAQPTETPAKPTHTVFRSGFGDEKSNKSQQATAPTQTSPTPKP